MTEGSMARQAELPTPASSNFSDISAAADDPDVRWELDYSTMPNSRTWVDGAIERLDREAARAAETHLLYQPVLSARGISVYFKDELTHPSGSLKHRLARDLFRFALCNGYIDEGTTIVEASSGSTAVSEAYFARELGLRFIAVVPSHTAPAKIEMICSFGGTCHFVDSASEISKAAQDLACRTGGYFMDQFTNAERATDWRRGNIATAIFEQMAREEHPIPAWIVCGAGTGGTSATIGRYLRHRRLATQVCVADPAASIFHDMFNTGNRNLASSTTSLIEGIGRPRAEPSFIPSVIDCVIRVPDAASIAALHFLEHRLGRRCGGSTGTNLIGCVTVMAKMRRCGECGSVVMLLPDGGERYPHYYDVEWLHNHALDIRPHLAVIEAFFSDQSEAQDIVPAVAVSDHGVVTPGTTTYAR